MKKNFIENLIVSYKLKPLDQQNEELLKIRIIDWIDADAKVDLERVKEGIFQDRASSLILFLVSVTDPDQTQDRTYNVAQTWSR